MSVRVDRLAGRALLWCLLFAVTTVANAQSRYRVTELPAPPGGGSWEFRDLNNNGELLVRSQGEGYVIQNQRLIAVNSRLPSNPDYIYVGGFNNKGQIVGAYEDAQGAFIQFVLSGDRTWPSPFGDNTTLYDIADAGHVLGFAAVAYQGRIRYLTTADGTTHHVDAQDINVRMLGHFDLPF